MFLTIKEISQRGDAKVRKSLERWLGKLTLTHHFCETTISH